MSEIGISIVFDADDFAPDWESNALSWFIDLKSRCPQFKVTLFTILGRWKLDVLKMFSSFDWIQLAAHGWTHMKNDEVLEWDKKKWFEVINKYERTGLFVPIFKAPNWEMSPLGYQVLKELGWAVAIRKHQINDVLVGMKYYCFETNYFAVHAHTWTMQAHSKEGMFLNWHDKSRFDFVINNLETKQ